MAKRGSPEHRRKISEGLKRFHSHRKHSANGQRWLKGAIKHPGALHRQLGIPKGTRIPVPVLKKAAQGNTKLAKRARLALTMRGFKHKG